MGLIEPTKEISNSNGHIDNENFEKNIFLSNILKFIELTTIEYIEKVKTLFLNVRVGDGRKFLAYLSLPINSGILKDRFEEFSFEGN